MTLALEGIKVIETAAVYAGPMAGRLLADWGADVIHIEHPVRGDIARSQRTRKTASSWTITSNIDYASQNFNRNKRSMTLDLSQEGGREIIYKLFEKADVFLSNFRPRELRKFKLEYDTVSQLNPRLIYANLSGYGRKGPDGDLPGFEDTGYFARSGMLHVLQAPGTYPAKMPFALGDNIAGLVLAYGIMTALLIRERTGIGQEVDVSLFQSGVFALSLYIAGTLVTGQDWHVVERKDVVDVLLDLYQTKDRRWIQLGLVQPESYWSRLCQAMEREDLEHDPRFASLESMMQNHAALGHILDEVFLSKTLAEWQARLSEAGLPFAPVQNLPEVTADPQARANDFFTLLDHPTYGRMEVLANPVKLGKTPAAVRMAPEFGQHTEEVLLEHGYTWEDIERFKQQRVIA